MDELHLALGAMYFGTKQDDRESFALLDRFVAAGGTWIDTANCYSFWVDPSGHGGQSELVIGRWLRSNPGVREHIRISTKVGMEPLDGGGKEGLSAAAIQSAVTDSIDRLGVESVDLLWAHGEDRSTPLAETVQAFGELARDGVATRLGWSNHPMWLVERGEHLAGAAGLPGFSALQQRHSYLSPRPDVPVEGQDHPFGMVSRETLDYVRSNHGWELWAYTSLLLGAYDRPDRAFTPAYEHLGTTRRLEALRDVAAELGVPAGRVVLAWLVGGDPPIRPIVGGSRPEQLDAAIAGARLELSPDQRERLDQAG